MASFFFCTVLHTCIHCRVTCKFSLMHEPSIGSQKVEETSGGFSFVVQPPAESRVTYEVRWGCSGFSPLWSWNPLGMNTAKPLWTASSNTGLSIGETSFSLDALWTYLASVSMCCLSYSHYASLWRTQPSLLDDLPHRYREQLLGPSKAIPSPRLNKPPDKCSSPDYLNGLSWIWSIWSMSCT